jgi:hypothetical protein
MIINPELCDTTVDFLNQSRYVYSQSHKKRLFDLYNEFINWIQRNQITPKIMGKNYFSQCLRVLNIFEHDNHKREFGLAISNDENYLPQFSYYNPSDVHNVTTISYPMIEVTSNQSNDIIITNNNSSTNIIYPVNNPSFNDENISIDNQSSNGENKPVNSNNSEICSDDKLYTDVDINYKLYLHMNENKEMNEYKEMKYQISHMEKTIETLKSNMETTIEVMSSNIERTIEMMRSDIQKMMQVILNNSNNQIVDIRNKDICVQN